MIDTAPAVLSSNPELPWDDLASLVIGSCVRMDPDKPLPSSFGFNYRLLKNLITPELYSQ